MDSYENDYLSGWDGNDQLFGGDHDDTLRGGKGANLFNCDNGFGVVVDFDPQNGDVRTNDWEVVNVVND
jgi:Ca2+-binding RTX toxin-like protein